MKYCEIEGNKLIKVNYIPDDMKIRNLIPENIEEICTGAFQNMSSLTDLYIPKNVKKINDNAFKDCCNLKSVVFDCLNCEVGFGAFYNCTSLYLLEIKHNTYFNSGVFLLCPKLEYVNIYTGDNIIPYRIFKLPHLRGCLVGEFIRKVDNIKLYKGSFYRKDNLLTKNDLYKNLCVGYIEDESLLWDDINEDIAIKGVSYLSSHKSAVDFFDHTFNDEDMCSLSDILLAMGICFVGREFAKKFYPINEKDLYGNLQNDTQLTIKAFKLAVEKYMDPYVIQRIEELQQHQYDEDWNLLKPEHAYQHTIRQAQQQGKGTHVPLDWTKMA